MTSPTRFRFPVPTLQSCCSKHQHPSSLALTPSSHRLLHNRYPHPAASRPPPHSFSTNSKPHSPPSKSIPSTVSASLHRQHSTRSSTHPPPAPHREFRWRKEGRWLVVTRIQKDRPPTPPPPRRKGAKRQSESPLRLRLSTSSPGSALFSGETSCSSGRDDGEAAEQFQSTTPLSAYSCSDNRRSQKTAARGRASAGRAEVERSRPYTAPSPSDRDPAVVEDEESARLSVFLRLTKQRAAPLRLEGKVRESLAVVKRSEDPYEDFRRSMMEMVLEKQMFEEKDLVQLLQILLSINSRNQHRFILDAFREIREALFGHRRRRGWVPFPRQ